MIDPQEQPNLVSLGAVILILVLMVCSARQMVNPDGGVCQVPAVSGMFKMCKR